MNQNKAEYPQYRWVVLAAYILILGVNQMLWVNFSSISTSLQLHFQVSELLTGLLTLIFPLAYVVVSLPSGLLIDRFGYKRVLNISGVIMVLFTIMRINDSHFYMLFLGQLGIALVQPFILNSISKLVADWFPRQQYALATGLGTVGIFCGMIIGIGISPVLYDNYGLHSMLIILAGITTICVTLFMFFVRERNRNYLDLTSSDTLYNLKLLFKNKNLISLFIISLIALGVFNSLMTWLQPLLKNAHITSEQTGIVGAILIIGGIIGSVTIPAISDKIQRRKIFLLTSCALSILLLYPLVALTHYSAVIITAAALGFAFLPGYALLITMTEEFAGSERAGTATSLVLLAGNAGGVIVSVAVEQFSHIEHTWFAGTWLMVGLLIMTLFITHRYLNDSMIKA